EEVGRGTEYFELERFGAVAAYTLDGQTAGELQSETFSGASVRMTVRGRSIHPGLAKDAMVNAIKLASQILERLPKDALPPEPTQWREGYVHPTGIRGDSRGAQPRTTLRASA